MKILLIGGNGNIGLSITKKLSQSSNAISVLSRKVCTNPISGINYINGDASDGVFLYQMQQHYKFDVVVNLAIQTPEQAKINIHAFRNSVKQFIFISSATVYNHKNNVVISESSPIGNEYSWYAGNKIQCEEIFLDAFKNSNFPVTIVRPSQTYSNDRIPLSVKGINCWSVMDRIINSKPVIVHGDGTSTWVCTHSEDFARGFTPLINNTASIGEIFHITSDEVVTWNEIYHDIAMILNKEINIVHIPTDLLSASKVYDLTISIKGDKQFSVIFDNSKIKELSPSFGCLIDLKSGLEKYFSYMHEHEALKVPDPFFDQWCDDIILHGTVR